MKRTKKILSILIKVLIGLGSLAIIYVRLRNSFTTQNLALLSSAAFSLKGLFCLGLCALLMPVNWGLESFKWRLITAPVQRISFARANRSVYSGVCLGNFAPGRATEFIAKILFFAPDNRSKVTVLHFINGMFQYAITVTLGFLALLLRAGDLGPDYRWLIYASGGIGLLMLSVLALCIYRAESILKFIAQKISRKNKVDDFHYRFGPRSILTLFSTSLLRYFVFSSQFAILLYIFHAGSLSAQVFTSISIYFLITATMPMFSMAEAAIRTAVALVVFKDSGVPDTVIALCTVLIWLVNIILPSLVGYYFLLRENFNFKLRGNYL